MHPDPIDLEILLRLLARPARSACRAISTRSASQAGAVLGQLLALQVHQVERKLGRP